MLRRRDGFGFYLGKSIFASQTRLKSSIAAGWSSEGVLENRGRRCFDKDSLIPDDFQKLFVAPKRAGVSAGCVSCQGLKNRRLKILWRIVKNVSRGSDQIAVAIAQPNYSAGLVSFDLRLYSVLRS